MARPRHPNKEIEKAIQHAEDHGWTILIRGRGHSWGQMRCPDNDKACRCGDFCQSGIWSTPRDADNHARDIRKIVDGCTGKKADADEDQSTESKEGV